MQQLTLVVAAVAVVGFALLSLFNWLQSRQAWKNKATEPPGPALIPWIGRVHDLPVEYMWTKFKEWGDVYGPIYRTQMLGDNFIIISDEKVAEDILVKRAKIFSDRPQIRSLFDPKSKQSYQQHETTRGVWLTMFQAHMARWNTSRSWAATRTGPASASLCTPS